MFVSRKPLRNVSLELHVRYVTWSNSSIIHLCVILYQSVEKIWTQAQNMKELIKLMLESDKNCWKNIENELHLKNPCNLYIAQNENTHTHMYMYI